MEIAPRSPAHRPARRPATLRSRVSNRPWKADGRSALARRVRDLAHDYAARCGGWDALSDVQGANVRKAAELTALAEEARADALRNGLFDPVGLVRLEGAARRAVRALALEERREAARPQTIAEYLREGETLTGGAPRPGAGPSESEARS